jgi:hypothetical protein
MRRLAGDSVKHAMEMERRQSGSLGQQVQIQVLVQSLPSVGKQVQHSLLIALAAVAIHQNTPIV